MTASRPSLRDLLEAREHDDSPGLLADGTRLTWREYVAASRGRASALAGLLGAARPPHVGVLLDNTPEMALQLAAAGWGAHVLVGLNTTRRGASLLADARKADVQVIVTDDTHRGLLDGLDLTGIRVLDGDDLSGSPQA
ncbi:MAG: AMP-binding protein, partial [Marmoricola sp.]